MSAYDKVGSKSCNKDSNITWQVLTSTIVSSQVKKSWLMRKTRKQLKIGRYAKESHAKVWEIGRSKKKWVMAI